MSALKDTQTNPRMVEMDTGQVTGMQDSTNSDSQSFILDRTWAKQAFLINDSKLGNAADIANRYWSSASAKFTDTRLGANIGINSRPQFTRYADVREKGRLQGRADVSIGNTTGNFGMGRYYSEAIDDPSQTIYMRFGVPQFNSITSFLTSAFDPNQVSLAKTGRDPSFLYHIGELAGSVAAVIAFPAIAITIVAGKVINSFFTRPSSKFYTLKPTMHLYWTTVNLLVNTIAVNKGILPKIMNEEDKQKIGDPFKIDVEHMKALSGILPDIFTDEFYFDIFALANKAQRLANKLFNDDYAALENGTATDYLGYVKKNSGSGSHATPISGEDSRPKLSAVLNKVLQFANYHSDQSDDRLEQDPKIDPATGEPKTGSWFQEFAKNLDAEFRDGSGYAVFKVDHTGAVSESFGNSVGESDLSQKLNQVSSTARQARFSFSEGNIAGGALGGLIKGALGAVGDVASGVLSGVTLGLSDGVMGLLGSGYIDIPKYWQSSTATLPRSSYTIQLISPYGNAISQMQNIYIPLCMLLAGALPLSTGKQSYTSPFICQIFDRGRCQTRLGMIESLSITRGTSNLPFDLKGQALALDVTFSVVDLSSIMHMPMSTGSLFSSNMTIDEDNILMDYLAVLGSMDMYSQVYPMAKAKLNLAKKIMEVQKLTSPAYWSSLFHDSSTSGMLKYISMGSLSAIEGGVRGSSVVSGNQ